jgi:two-component system invasion response regulator UvrY
MKKITIIIVDDHTLVRESWRMVLNSDRRLNVIAECGSAESAIDEIRRRKPDVVLLDINLPGMNGIDAVQEIKKVSPPSKIVGVSLHALPAYTRKMMMQGASGYVTKNSSKEEMIEAILKVSKGEKYICRHIKDIISSQMMEENDPSAKLALISSREMEIISYIKEGLTSKEIAGQLKISLKTVEVHRYNILRKLNLKNSAGLVQFMSKYNPDA